MRTCPTCKNDFPDDANFCPMDASRLPDPAASIDTIQTGPSVSDTIIGQAIKTVADRYVLIGDPTQTPTGAVYEATDMKAAGRRVQVKLVATEVLPNAGLVERALREFKQIGSLDVKQVVRITDEGKTESGQVYVAFEPPQGSTLEEYIGKRGPLSLDEARRVIQEVGTALAETQRLGVIHRDLSPRHIFFTGKDVQVGDFALAEPLADNLFGSASYMSPEQAEGRPIDQRSSIYSLGAIFYFLLTGEAPFQGPDSKSLIQQHLHAEPPVPSQKRAGLSADVDRMVAHALDKSGSRRHLTLQQFLTELEALGKPPAPETAAPTEVAAPEPKPASDAPRPTAEVRALAATVMGMASPFAAGGDTNGRVDNAATEAAVKSEPATVENKAVQTHRSATPIKVEASEALQNAVAAAQEKVAAKAEAQPAAKRGFRETGWFKVGEIEEKKSQQEDEAYRRSRGDVLAASGTTGQHAIYDPEKVDVTEAERGRFSLRTGATQNMPVVKAEAPSDQMSPEEMLAEIDSSKKKLLVAGIIVAVVVVGLALFFIFGGKKEALREHSIQYRYAVIAPASKTAPSVRL